MSDCKDELIAALERSLGRERQARKISEVQLEVYSRDIYESNVQLKAQTKEVSYKQKHLAFLTGLAENIWQLETPQALLENYLKECCTFLSHSVATFFEINKSNQVSQLILKKTEDIAQHPFYATFDIATLSHMLQKIDMKALKRHLIKKDSGHYVELSAYLKDTHYCLPNLHVHMQPIYRNVDQADEDNLGVMCFFYQSHNDIKELKLQTINTFRPTLALALQRKRAEYSMRNKVLELEKANNNLTTLQAHLVESEKLASLGLLSAGIAHEINNPLGFVMSNLDTMQDYLTDLHTAISPLDSITPETLNSPDGAYNLALALKQLNDSLEVPYLLKDSQEILDSSLTGLHRVKEIVADLRVFSRMDNHALVKVDLESVISRSLNMVSNELKYEYHVETALNKDCYILGNDGQLQQVFINLFMNAKHSMEAGGKLKISCVSHDERVVVCVEDNGHGIKEKDLKEIFTPFFTTKAPGKGTGLGLSISYSILQEHHAEIEVKSEIGKGTTFTLTFAVYYEQRC
ncbi:sensor histidine kinase [Psychromonas sp. Urea-02u-13]|uniref:sensor histidine kinase n=1 Tax=Psychromonas sp. Urea-02u-13 TaxID=2058326 RepID=UPI000C3320F5|nr:ATP-binding protein [Psychromonas sp. Urea-02u-13]PKG39821.1 hypothetical protein CXF74_06610 [Psychromonas sp. Urea-02u-13]